MKTDRVDGETLVRVLLGYKRGEPRICAMVRVPTPEEEDRRRIGRERKVLMGERIQHSNRIKGLLFSQGITAFSPLRRDRRRQLDALTTGDGRQLPEHMKCQILREMARLEGVIDQLTAIDAERDAMLAVERDRETSVVSMLTNVVGIGATSTTDDRSRPTRALPRRHGKAAQCRVSRASANPGTGVCAAP